MTDAELIEWQEREHPVCNDCDGRRGIDCKGHCLDCGSEPAPGEDLCPACITMENAA
jgi:hypothetical protein